MDEDMNEAKQSNARKKSIFDINAGNLENRERINNLRTEYDNLNDGKNLENKAKWVLSKLSNAN